MMPGAAWRRAVLLGLGIVMGGVARIVCAAIAASLYKLRLI
jgi:hypothetical protein